MLWALPELRQRYVDAAAAIFKSAPAEPAADFAAQFAKVWGGLLLVGGTRAAGMFWMGGAAPNAAGRLFVGVLSYASARCCLHAGLPSATPQVGVALLTGKTGAAPAADGAESMAYEKEAVTTEGGLEATVEVS